MVDSTVVGSTAVDSAVVGSTEEGSVEGSMIAGSTAGSALAYLLAQGSVTDILIDTTGALTGTTGIVMGSATAGNAVGMSSAVKLRTVRGYQDGLMRRVEGSDDPSRGYSDRFRR